MAQTPPFYLFDAAVFMGDDETYQPKALTAELERAPSLFTTY